jgi:hypothetical protein
MSQMYFQNEWNVCESAKEEPKNSWMHFHFEIYNLYKTFGIRFQDQILFKSSNF